MKETQGPCKIRVNGVLSVEFCFILFSFESAVLSSLLYKYSFCFEQNENIKLKAIFKLKFQTAEKC